MPYQPDRPPMLELRSLRVAYAPDGPAALDDLSLSVAEGEIVSVLGASGSGKSTLLRAIAGLVPATAGAVRIGGHEVTTTPPERREVGMMFQDHALFPHLDVADNIAYGLRMHRVPRARRSSRVGELLDLVRLEGFGGRPVGSLSGGERQRVALARALAIEPKVLLLDEPLSSLDRALREELLVHLGVIFREQRLTVIHVTHDHAEAFALADTVVLLHRGAIEQVDPPSIIWSTPTTVHAARVMGHRNVGPAASFGPVLPTLGSPSSVAPARPVMIRSDAIVITRAASGAEADGQLVAATTTGPGVALVVALTHTGSTLHCICSHEQMARLTVGDGVHVSIDPAGVVLLEG